jgi:predicted nuclease with TOPRIM domain
VTIVTTPADVWQIDFEYDAPTYHYEHLAPVVVPIPAELEMEGHELQWLVHQVLVDALQQAQAWQAGSDVMATGSRFQQERELEAALAELTQLRTDYQTLTDSWQAQAEEIDQLESDKQFLEQTLRQIPVIYRRKFEERLQPVRERIQRLQTENQQLREQVQKLSQPTSAPALEDIDQTAPSLWPLLPFGKGSGLAPVAS